MSRASDERLKLTAGFIDRAAGTLVALGIVAPLAGRLYGIGTPPARSTWFLGGSFAAWLTVALLLHWAARWLLRGLDEE